MTETRVKMKPQEIFSILIPESLKGYIYVEAPNAQVANRAISGIKHMKNIVPGVVQFQDLERFLVTKQPILELSVGDLVMVMSGPFKRMNAKISKIEPARSEVTILLLDAPYSFPVTVSANYLKLVQKAPSAEGAAEAK